METLIDRITVDNTVCNGKPTIRGKRIAVQTILEFLGVGDTRDETLAAGIRNCDFFSVS